MVTKGEKIRFNGDIWTIVDVVPAFELAEMVAVMLEDEGFAAKIYNPNKQAQVMQALGASPIGLTTVIVPEQQAEQALAFIDENVEDFEGDDAQALLEQMALEQEPES